MPFFQFQHCCLVHASGQINRGDELVCNQSGFLCRVSVLTGHFTGSLTGPGVKHGLGTGRAATGTVIITASNQLIYSTLILCVLQG